MNRGDVVKTARPSAERGHKTGFYVVVSRPFVRVGALNEEQVQRLNQALLVALDLA